MAVKVYSVSLTLVTLPLPPVASTLLMAVPPLGFTVMLTLADLPSLESTALSTLTVGAMSWVGLAATMPSTLTSVVADFPAALVTVTV